MKSERLKKTVSISGTDHIEDGEGVPTDVVLVADDVMASVHFEQSIELLRELIEAHEGEPRATVARMFYLKKSG